MRRQLMMLASIGGAWVLAILPGGLHGQSQDDVAAITRKLNCPTCPGFTLEQCPTQLCQQMRDLIGEKVRAGQSEAEIVEYFVEQYGLEALNSPPGRGFHLLAWVTPAAFLLLGAYAVSAALRAMRRPARPAAVQVDVQSEYVRRLNRELEAID